MFNRISFAVPDFLSRLLGWMAAALILIGSTGPGLALALAVPALAAPANPELLARDYFGDGGKPREETLEIRSLNNARSARARKGKAADLGFKPTQISRVE